MQLGHTAPNSIFRLQNQSDVTAFGRVVSILIRSCQDPMTRKASIQTRSNWRFNVFCAALIIATPLTAAAQRPDSTRVRARPTTISDTIKAPISPRRAFLYSALLPGYGQSILGRHKAAAAMLVIEAMAIAMIRESAADVREARRMSGDSVVLSYVDANGAPDTVRAPRHFDTQYVHVRQSHVEDWVAFLVANHLFSGADAFVAANLWDVPTQLGIRVAPRGATVGAKLTW
jgi:hypothetical protein